MGISQRIGGGAKVGFAFLWIHTAWSLALRKRDRMDSLASECENSETVKLGLLQKSDRAKGVLPMTSTAPTITERIKAKHEIDIRMHMRFKGSLDQADRILKTLNDAFKPRILKATIRDITEDTAWEHNVIEEKSD